MAMAMARATCASCCTTLSATITPGSWPEGNHGLMQSGYNQTERCGDQDGQVSSHTTELES